MSELQIFGLVMSIIAPVTVGWVIARMRWLESSADQVLSWLFLHVCTPPLIVVLLAKQDLATLLDARFILATLVLLLLIYLGLLQVHTRLLGRRLREAAMAAFAGTKFNTVIIGLPVLLATIGHHAIVPTIINLVAEYFTILPVTLLCTSPALAGGIFGRRVAAVFAQALKKTITHPLVVSTLVGLSWAGLELPLSPWLEKILLSVGNAAIPLALIAVGMSLNAAGVRAYVFEISWMSAVRVILSPTLAIVIAMVLGLQPVFAIALVISFSLPTAKMVLPLAEEQGVYVEQTAGIITVTTLSLLLVWPVAIWICEQLWPGVVAAHG
jgi:malonate transporter